MGPSETNALRAALNIYPTDTEKIEALILDRNWNLSAIANNDAVGLPAIDYLINNSSLTDQEVMTTFSGNADRFAFLNDLITRIASITTASTEEWENGNFLNNYKSESSNGTDVGSALGLTINAIDLHLQRYLRDGKVAIPAGVRSAGVPRPQAVEALHGGYSRDLLESAIQAYIDLIDSDGNSTTSIEDYLDAIDQSPIADDILQALERSLTLVRSLEQNFVTQIRNWQ